MYYQIIVNFRIKKNTNFLGSCKSIIILNLEETKRFYYGKTTLIAYDNRFFGFTSQSRANNYTMEFVNCSLLIVDKTQCC